MRARSAAAGVVMALAGVAVVPGIAAAAPSAHDAQAWYRQVLNDLHPLQSTLPAVLDAASSWAGGSESARAARQEFGRDEPELQRVEGQLHSLTPLAGHARARNDFVAGIDLYAEAVAVDQAATELPPGALRGQLQRSYQRIRQLGDIVFDQGTTELAPLLGPSLSGADVAAAAHIPDWSAVGLAPAAPLASAWRASGSPPTGTQPEAAWAAEVGMDGAPAQQRVHSALVGRLQPATLAALASALNTAEVDLSSLSAPAGDQLASNRQRLGLLVDAEALLDTEAGRLGRGAPVRALAKAGTDLGAVGGELRAESRGDR
jgi:hypothetical protein